MSLDIQVIETRLYLYIVTANLQNIIFSSVGPEGPPYINIKAIQLQL